MYEQFFNFRTEPFRLSPDHAFAYSHKGYNKAQAYMTYAFHRAEGFVMITGRPGTGKTTLVGALLDQLVGENVATANLVCTQLKADDLLKVVAYEFGVSPAVVEKGDLLQRLAQKLKAWHRDGRRVLLIVDEAQDLSPSAMEELRLLTNIHLDSTPLLQIFLLGQPELRKLVLSPRMEQVHQRIIAASHIQPLESDETCAYICHRLESVGWRGDPAISKAVYPLIHKFSEGIPRRINLICSRLFLHCAVEERHHIRVPDFREVIGELQGESLAAGLGFSEQDFEAAALQEAELEKQQQQDIAASSREKAARPVNGALVSMETKTASPRPGAVRRSSGGEKAPNAHASNGSARKPGTMMYGVSANTVQSEPCCEEEKKAVSSDKTKAGRMPPKNGPAVNGAVGIPPDNTLRGTGTESTRHEVKRSGGGAWPILAILLVSASLVLFGIFWPFTDIVQFGL